MDFSFTESLAMVLLLGTAMFLYFGLPVIVPAIFLVRKRHVLERPWWFGMVAVVLCLLVQAAIYKSEQMILANGGLALLKSRGQETSMVWIALVPWLLQAFLAVLIVGKLSRRFGKPA